MGYKTYTCPHAARCGACEWLAVPYPIQLSRKQAALEELLSPFDLKVDRVIGMDEPLNYRYKIMSPYAPGKKGRPICGFYARGTHDIIETDVCLAEHEAGRPIITTIADLCRRFKITAYNEDTGRGLLRHVVIRVSSKTGDVMVILVINRKEFPHKKAFVKELRHIHPEISSVVFNVNTRKTNTVLGPLFMTAYGQDWLEDELCGCTFRIPAGAFYQTNPKQTEVLYNAAIDLGAPEDGEFVLDAYCGIGTIGIIAAKRARIELVGVESVPSAINIARENARINHVKNAVFICADAGEFMVHEEALFDLVFMDPPRAGASEEFLESLMAKAPARIVYISCNPVTQARDIEYLSPMYEPVKAVGVDMFPHTKHLESVVLLELASLT